MTPASQLSAVLLSESLRRVLAKRSDLRRESSDDVKDAGSPATVRVGEWYLATRSAHDHAKVKEAYTQLQTETDHLFTILSRDPVSSAARVVFTRCPRPYASDAELIAAVSSGCTLEVTSAATAEGRLHPILGCEFGGAFDRFRAVHDLIGHGWCGYGFAFDSEYAAWRVQDLLHSGLARSALATELYGVNAARSIIGKSPELKALLFPIRDGRPVTERCANEPRFRPGHLWGRHERQGRPPSFQRPGHS